LSSPGTLPLPLEGIQQQISANGIVGHVPNLPQSLGKGDKMGLWELATPHPGGT
jgi:hypothetical protein